MIKYGFSFSYRIDVVDYPVALKINCLCYEKIVRQTRNTATTML